MISSGGITPYFSPRRERELRNAVGSAGENVAQLKISMWETKVSDAHPLLGIL